MVDEIVNGYTYHSTDPNDWTNYTFHHDHLNSVTALTGHAGSTEETTRYDAFGQPLNLVLPGTGNDLLYTGREYDRGTGLYYYRARYYDLEIGRFISEDPLGFAAGINFYAYVNNNPINFNDPTGKLVTPETIWDVANVGIGSYSLTSNLREGNYGWAAIDAVGLGYDVFATAVPFLPAGVSAGLSALRAGNTVVNSAQVGMDVARVANVSNDVARAISTTGNAMQTGQAIHREVGTILDQGSMLSSSANNYFRGANGATGRQADLSWGNTQGGSGGWGVWADLTTPPQWGQHVADYTSSFGEGVPLLYQAGTGLTNWSPLYSGAGAGLTTLQFGTDSLFSGSASGGFLLYPNKPNNNAMQSVYRK